MDSIEVQGARTHNLKNLNLSLPRDKMIVITGLSGSGKSSLAFDTLYAEGQRRYVESLSAYARQFLSMMDKPDVDHIDGLSPAISIEQKATSHNPRSTVGTVTEIYDYLRLLFARVGDPMCPTHHLPLKAQTVTQMVDALLSYPEGTKLMILAPVVVDRKGEHVRTVEALKTEGYVRARIDGVVMDLAEFEPLDKHKKHRIEVVVDRLKVREDISTRMAESLETALDLTDGIVTVDFMTDDIEPLIFSSRFACSECGYSIAELEPKLFSFNSPAGACSDCDGLGIKQFFDEDKVVGNREISLSGGAVKGWDKRAVYYHALLESLAQHDGFSLDTPFEQLPAQIRKRILYGTGTDPIRFQYRNDRGHTVERDMPFEGIINNLRRRYRETESDLVREELARYLSSSHCESCQGSRLCTAARHVFINDLTLPQLVAWPVGEALDYFNQLTFAGSKQDIADKILVEIRSRLKFLTNVGLDYLNLSRSADTLSGGEAQRIRLASQIGAGLVGVMYILDEPSIGLHQRDNEKLLQTLTHLRDLGNTVIVVEHDEEAILSADHVLDIGPGAGIHGGQIVAQGTPDVIKASAESLTGQYLSGARKIEIPKERVPCDPDKMLVVRGATGNNLREVDAHIPVGLMTCITGVSGSGKSTLINDTLYPHAANTLNRASHDCAPCASVEGLDQFDKVVDIDQSPIGRTPRSNPATYTGIFTPVRDLYAATGEARSRGYKPGRFSFNVKGGRCEACQGDGVIKVEMHFLPDVYVKCDQCQGKRYNRETLEIKYKGKDINEVLEMSVEEAREFFDAVPVLNRKLQTLMDVGLSYITLGQAATTLSGGEAQRVKLARELSKRDTGKTLYILDEPTTGLHFEDIAQLLKVLYRLKDRGNTIVVIEHNLDVIKTADWIIDLGPEGGVGGGQIVAEGPPESIVKVKASHTGRFLKPMLK